MNMASRCELSRVSSSIQAYLYVTRTLDPISSASKLARDAAQSTYSTLTALPPPQYCDGCRMKCRIVQ